MALLLRDGRKDTLAHREIAVVAAEHALAITLGLSLGEGADRARQGAHPGARELSHGPERVLGLDAEGLGDLVHFVEIVAALVAVCLDDRPALDFVGVEQALSGAPLDHQGELEGEVMRVADT
ncbi:hypothetical protein QHF83_34920 [Polyangium sp. 15x6]|nr:hypothetical protein [Polyangium sp. 15x6]MDI3288557.1 hypothetical protein [Polyangium sp. 15x6]